MKAEQPSNRLPLSTLTAPLLPFTDEEPHGDLDDGHGIKLNCRSPSNSEIDDFHSVAASTPSFASHILRRARRNLKRTLALTFFAFSSRCIWSQSSFSVYVAMTWKEHPGYIGYVTAVMGASQVLSSVTARLISRRCDAFSTRKGTRRIMCSCSFVGCAAVVLSLHAIWNSMLSVLMAAMALWGILWGISETVLPIIFGEAVSYLVTEKQSFKLCSHLIRLGNVVGISVTLVTFLLIGNKWTTDACAFVMTVGLVSSIPVLFLLCSLRVVLGDDELEGEDHNDRSNVDRDEDCGDFECDSEDLRYTEGMEDGNIDMLVLNVAYHQFSPGTSQGDCEIDTSPDNDGDTSESMCSFPKTFLVPVLVLLTDTLSSFAAGFSIRYFPVFFANELALDPVSVQVLFLVVPLGQWLLFHIANTLGRTYGPCRTCVTLQYGYVSCVLSMILCQRKGMPLWVVCGFFVMQASLMNSTSSLSKAVILQNVPERDLSNWAMADTFPMALFSMGAATGGVIVGRWGILTNFTVTAILQLFASLPLTFLCCVNPGVDVWEHRGCPMSGYAEQASVSTDPFESCCDSETEIMMFQDCVSGEVSSKTITSLQRSDLLDRHDCD